MTTFTFTGKLVLVQDSDKFNAFAYNKYDSGWEGVQLICFGVNDSNRHMFTISGGHFPDKKDYTVKTFSPSTKDDNGNVIKGQMIEIPWADRNKPESIKKVAEFRKFLVDADVYGRRSRLTHLSGKIKEGTEITDEELKEVGLTDPSEVNDALEKSKNLRKEFITEWDFAEFMYKLLSSGKFNNKTFYIRGVIEKQWSDHKGQWYTAMKPQRIYLAKADAQEECYGTAPLFFSNGAVDDASLDDKGKYYVNAYTFEYDSARKKAIPAEFKLAVPKGIPHKDGKDDGKDEARAKRVIQKFTVTDGKVYEFGVDFDILNGSQKVEITEDMLSDDQKEDLELGLITMDEIRAEMGGSVYGDRVTENLYKGVMRGYTKGGRRETAYLQDDLIIPPLEDKDVFGSDDDEEDEKSSSTSSEDDDDNFDDLFN